MHSTWLSVDRSTIAGNPNQFLERRLRKDYAAGAGAHFNGWQGNLCYNNLYISNSAAKMDIRTRQCLILLILPVVFLAGCSRPTTVLGPVVTPAIPLDGSIIFSVEEVNSQISLKLETEEIFADYNNDIETALDTSSEGVIKITIKGVILCSMRFFNGSPRECLPATGPARSSVNLGILSGEYKLVFEYGSQIQTYHLTVTDTDLVFVPEEQNTFIKPTYLEWKRLAERSMWFVVYNRWSHNGRGEFRPMERSIFEGLSAAFFQDIEEYDVEQFLPSEGHYTNYLFASPWKSDLERIPYVNPEFPSVGGPYIRYYTYQGGWERIQELIDRYRVQGLGIDFSTTSGNPYANGK
jgi:hypothetical protein